MVCQSPVISGGFQALQDFPGKCQLQPYIADQTVAPAFTNLDMFQSSQSRHSNGVAFCSGQCQARSTTSRKPAHFAQNT
jgi:hypothetical protein